MKVVCAWCGKDMAEKDGGGTEGNSHGICSECLAKLEEKEQNGTEGKAEQERHC